MNKSRHVTFRISEQEYQDILLIKGDMSMSEYLRKCVAPIRTPDKIIYKDFINGGMAYIAPTVNYKVKP